MEHCRKLMSSGPGTSNPSWLALHPSKKYLYAVNENNPGTVSAFSIGSNGTLTFLNTVSSQGSGPAHMSVDPSGNYALVANYGSGNVAVMALENRDWGYRRIVGALSNLGYRLARGTIANILKQHGIEPAPERSRKTTWKEFLSQHWELIVAADFFTVEVWTRHGLQRFLVLFFIELSTRKVEIAGIARTPNGLWMSQIARNLTDAGEGILARKRYLIHDRDPLFTAEFCSMIADTGVQSVKLPPRSPNLNAYAERFVRTIKESCLDRMILFGEGSLRKAVREFVAHYLTERNHQGLGNRRIISELGGVENTEAVCRRDRLGGLLNYYYREAA
jgi:putative transposase